MPYFLCMTANATTNEIKEITARMHSLEKRIAEMNALGMDENVDKLCIIWDKLKVIRDQLKSK